MYWPLWGLALALQYSNKRGGWNKREGGAKVKVVKSILKRGVFM